MGISWEPFPPVVFMYAVACKVTVFVHTSLFIVAIGSGLALPHTLSVDLFKETYICTNDHSERVSSTTIFWIRI